MNRTTRMVVAGVAALAPLLVVAAPAEAATYYSSCAKLTKDFRNGVAKSKAAANRAVRDGHSRPATSKRAKNVYWKNYTRLDRDRDGTACEN